MAVCENCPVVFLANAAASLDKTAVNEHLNTLKSANPDLSVDNENTVTLKEAAFKHLTTNASCPGPQIVLQETIGASLVTCPFDQLAVRSVILAAVKLHHEQQTMQSQTHSTGQYL